MQCWGGEVHLLAALPKAWPTGRLYGVRAHGGVELDVDWTDGQLARAQLRGPARAKVALRYRGQRLELTLDSQGRARVGSASFPGQA